MNTVSQEKIKSTFLKKLLKELIKRGAPNSTIKQTLDEAAGSLTDYISEMDLKNLESLEQNFGTPQQFCNEQMIEFNRDGYLAQLFYNVIFSLSFLTIFGFGFSFLTFWEFIYGHALSIPSAEALMQISSGINGLLGTLFCLNVLVWILNRYFSKSLSTYDLRNRIQNKATLGIYWYLVLICVSMFSYLYSKVGFLLPFVWKQNMKFLVIEGLLRWLLLLFYLSTTAILYTIKYVKNNSAKLRKENRTYLIDSLEGLVFVFVLISFVVPQPGIGLLVILLGISTILTNNVTVKTWLLGVTSICVQFGVLFRNLIFFSFDFLGVDRTSIIFGVKFTLKGNEEKEWYAIIVCIILILLWTISCILIFKRENKKYRLKFGFRKVGKQYISVILIFLVGVSLLGSQPQETTLKIDFMPEYDQINDLYKINERVWIPRKGKIYVSFYDYVSFTLWDYDSNGSVVNITNIVVNGSWQVTWQNQGESFKSFFKQGFFSSLAAPTVFVVEREEYNVTQALWYFVIEAKSSGILEYHSTILEYLSTVLREEISIIIPSMSYRWVAQISWFPFYLEPIVVGFILSFLLIDFDTKNQIKSRQRSKGRES